MDKSLKEIVIDNGSFKELREGENLYIDKTKYLLNLVGKKGGNKFYFLSRPRRFGKSLTLSTLDAIFKGEKELFKGTYIYDNYDFESYPVINITLNGIGTESKDDFLNSLKYNVLYQIALDNEIDEKFPLDQNSPSILLTYLITTVRRKYNKQVVLLVDEYDYPLLDSIQKDCFEELRSLLESFYSVLKARGNDIKFCFVTGVTRFSHVSIFSKLNNLVDISDDPQYASICGYTDEELDYYFKPYIEKYFLENNVCSQEERKAFRGKIKEFYNGYRFSPDSLVTLYNPVSVGSFFMGNCRFKNFWVSTGSQNLVREILKLYPSALEDGNNEITESSIQSYELKDILKGTADDRYVRSYLFQAGYLTIKDAKDGTYILDYPDEEVRDALLSYRFSVLGFDTDAEKIAILKKAITSGNTEEFIKFSI